MKKQTLNGLLIEASKLGLAPVAKHLLQAGANVRANDDLALKWASNNGHLEVVKVLLQAGAGVHAGEDYALRYASWNGHLEVVKVLKHFIETGKVG